MNTFTGFTVKAFQEQIECYVKIILCCEYFDARLIENL